MTVALETATSEAHATPAAPDLITPWRNYRANLYTRSPCTSNRASQCSRIAPSMSVTHEHSAKRTNVLRRGRKQGRKIALRWGVGSW